MATRVQRSVPLLMIVPSLLLAAAIIGWPIIDLAWTSTQEVSRFGRLTVGDSFVKWYRTQEYYDSGAWRGTWQLDGGGALMNQAIHSVDLLTWLMGPVSEISAFTGTLAHERIEVEDVAVATVKFENGAVGVI